MTTSRIRLACRRRADADGGHVAARRGVFEVNLGADELSSAAAVTRGRLALYPPTSTTTMGVLSAATPAQKFTAGSVMISIVPRDPSSIEIFAMVLLSAASTTLT